MYPVTFADHDVNLFADAGTRLASGRGAGAAYKVAIVGSGPAGLSAAAHAARNGVSHVLLERALHPNDTIFKFQKRKHVMATPEFLPLRSDLAFEEGSREALIERWAAATEELDINIRLGVEVTRITGERGAFTIGLASGETLLAEFVVLAIGIQGNLNKLRLPGAELPFVQYQLDDPDEYRGEEIVVIGTGDAGLENALALTANNRVSIVNRGADFPRAKAGNVELVEAAIKRGDIVHLVNSAPKEIEPGFLVLDTADSVARVASDRVIARIGALPPRRFVEGCGVAFPSDSPTAFPPVSETYESNVPGLYIIGAVAGYPLIKHCLNQGYEVIEYIQGESLAKAGWIGAENPDTMKRIVDELGRAIASFSEIGLRHRDIRPSTILLRTREPLDLVITSFGSARLSDFDLDAVSPLELTYYSAPETIVGAVSGASDWWSLGMIVLEQVTSGACFSDINQKAFQIHVVTRGVDIPPDLAAPVRLLLRGLLARDPLKRWSWPQVRAWLSGEPVEAPEDGASTNDAQRGPQIKLGDRIFHRPDVFALAAAESQNWEVGRDLTLKGAVATWLDERGSDQKMAARIRQLASDENLTEDFRHALALMVLNSSLPLTLSGDIVTPAWLLNHPIEGYSVVTGRVSWYLEKLQRESWIVRLKARSVEVRERAKMLEIELDEEVVRVAILTSSRANMEVKREQIRRIYPDSDHAGLSSILERTRLSDEDLIILISAALPQYLPLDSLVGSAEKLAERSGINLDRVQARVQLVRPRRELFFEIDERIANFARCGLEKVDEWADTFRVERRLSLDRTIVLLTIPRDAWKEPPRQQYLANLLEVFEKRVSGSVQRGPLVRFVIGKTTPRVDLFELGTGLRPSEVLLNHVISRSETPLPIDPQSLNSNELLFTRFRRLASHAQMFRRDSGIDGRYLGFPFLSLSSGRFGAIEGKRRLAPILLWPVAFDSGNSGAGAVNFDGEREEIRLNPALEALLGPAEFAKWKSARDEILGRSAIKVADVIDGFSGLAMPRERILVRLPGPEMKLSANELGIFCCAALFNAEFTGQAICEDLRQMRMMPAAGTGIEALLRVQSSLPATPSLPLIPERDRYFTVPSDPSQERAVFKARLAPGLLIKGPPGTGKSQTIVNIVADSIGRGQSVLIICQKQAALRVVQKRLEAEDLGERLFLVIDVNRDRESVIRAIRDQLEKVRESSLHSITTLKRAREDMAVRIEALENEIDRHHQAVHLVDDQTGFSYRSLLSELVALESKGAPIDIPRLRPSFTDMKRDQVSGVEEVCAPLARLWLASGYEGSPLHVLKRFSADASTLGPFLEDFAAFSNAESNRCGVFLKPAPSFEIDNPSPYQEWLKVQGPILETMDPVSRQSLSQWYDLFKPISGETSQGTGIIESLEGAQRKFGNIDDSHHDDTIFPFVFELNMDEMHVWLKIIYTSEAKSFFQRLNPARWLRRRKIRQFLVEKKVEPSETRITAFKLQLEMELALGPIRRTYKDGLEELGLLKEKGAQPVKVLRREIGSLLVLLKPLTSSAFAAFSCPNTRLSDEVVKSATLEGYYRLKAQVECALERHAAKEMSKAALKPLSQWFEAAWTESCLVNIEGGNQSMAMLDIMRKSFTTLEPFQLFRVRAGAFDTRVMTAFAALRSQQNGLAALQPRTLEPEVRRIIQREACLAWKTRFERERPELLFQQSEIESKVRSLAELDEKIRGLNKKLLATDIALDRLGSHGDWENLTRLKGPRTKRLREIFDLGIELGLSHLRPIWLMNPEVASRVLPLKGGLFDVVIYDEASQMPVEYAVPTLFRGRRIVISGDEKQMPPTSFFSSRIDGEEDEEIGGECPEDAATEAEKNAYEETWNRREVKDCPDLLQLGNGVLPPTTLQIHYRSKYRDLIGFSNCAFYQGSLSIPVRHPDSEILRTRPIEVVRVEGTYENQTNESEATRVVEILAEQWKVALELRPSIGVVTFNRKQADLVDDAILKRRNEDPGFQRAFQEESERKQAGEDMGFFVKNVENVQGDERDIIIFSTTFGKDKNGAFRRNFGVLGQSGGERRLNVAITRAREKVILVTSIPVADVSDIHVSGRTPNKPRDFLQAYLDYAQKLDAGNLSLARGGASRLAVQDRRAVAESVEQDGFSTSVADFIRKLGFEPVRSGEPDAFGLDFAIEDKRTGLFGIGIECDSPRHVLLATARAREIWRPKVLSRAINRVHRVTSQGWYQRGDEERRQLREAIQAALS